MTDEQLDAIKARVMLMRYQAEEGIAADSTAIEIAFLDTLKLITEVEQLQQIERNVVYVIEEVRKLREALSEIYAMHQSPARAFNVERIMKIAADALEVDHIAKT